MALKKDNIKSIKRQITDCEKIFTICASDERLILRILKSSYKPIRKRQTTQFETIGESL